MLCAVVAVLMQPSPLEFGATRLEMGERVKRLDAAWLKNRKPESRRAAVPHLSAAVTAFFSGRFSEACRALDTATATLENRSLRLADAVILRPSPFVLRDERWLDVRVSWAYDLPGVPLSSWEGLPLKSGVPMTKRLAVAGSGDRHIRWRTRFSSGEKVWIAADRISAFDSRLAELEKSEDAEVKSLAELIKSSSIAPSETTFNLTALLREAESLSRGETRSGSHEVKLTRHQGVPMRAWIPGKPRGVVIALHGAGGSENMFFETYGAGLAVAEAKKRQWAFVSPRSGSSSVAAALDWLRVRYGIEGLPVFVMGHSMGGGLAANSAEHKPAAVALFAPASGALSVAMLKVPVFLSVGEQEIGMLAAGSRRMAEQLKANPSSEFKTYPNCEHLMIVADALPDAYRFFDKVNRGRSR